MNKVHLRARYVEEGHVSVFHPATYKALEAIFDGWQIPASYLTDRDISLVERHYRALSERLGFDVQVPESYYRAFGYSILAEHEFDYAQWTFEQYATAYPRAAGARVGLGDVYLMQGAMESASTSYKEALQLNPSNERARHMLDVLNNR